MMAAEHHCLLIAEDPDIAAQLTGPFAEAGWELRACTSAREAVYSVKRQRVDALLIAATLPDERGDALFYRLAAIQPGVRARTAFLTRTEAEEAIVQVTRRPGFRVPVMADRVVRAVTGRRDTTVP